MAGGARHVVLVGFMASGKTTLGARVAELLGRPFVDVDDRIEALAGAGIDEVFARQGEARFREFESAALRQVLGGPPAVIATGGGAPMDDDNWRRIFDGNVVVHLHADAGELLARIGDGEGRPLTKSETPGAMRDRLLAILERRQARYAEAPLRIDSTGRGVEECADEVVALARGAGIGDGPSPGEVGG